MYDDSHEDNRNMDAPGPPLRRPSILEAAHHAAARTPQFLTFSQLAQAVFAERIRQDQKWGAVKDGCFDSRSLYQWLAILTEEVGKLAQEMLDAGRLSRLRFCHPNLRAEAVQVAAVAFAIIEHLDRTENAHVA